MSTIFVTGASGQLGGRVLHHLLARGVAPGRIVAGSRRPERLADWAGKGIAVRQADFEDADGLARSFEGADTVLVISTELLDAGGHRIEQHRTAVASAVAAGAKRIAFTSIPDPAGSPLHFAPDHVDTERVVKATGLAHLIFRNGWYQENLLQALPAALRSGQWHTAAQGGKTTYVARDDIAAAIAAALAAPPPENRTYTLTGPDTLSVAEVAALAGGVAGKPLAAVDVTEEQLAAGLRSAGVPEVFVKVLLSADAAARAGKLAVATSDLETLTGRQGKRLATFLQENRAALGA